MGRNVNQEKSELILGAIQINDGRLRASDIARQTGMHPQAVSRLLATMDKTTGVLLQEDDSGFLGIFSRRRK